MLRQILVIVGLILGAGSTDLFSQDTLPEHVLKNVTIKADAVKEELSSQRMVRKDMSVFNALQLSDAVKFLSGITVKDYGGVGGMKTVSVRSLGANHTAVSYDGLPLSDAQTGQIDVGKLGFDNLASMVVEVGAGQHIDLFKPARLFASANTLLVETQKPALKEKPFRIGIFFRTGAYQLCNPSLLLESRIGKKITVSLFAEYLYNKGNYIFLQHYGGLRDSVSKERRSNADVSLIRTEVNLFYSINSRHDWHFKAYCYHTNKGLPGAAILYNPVSKQRIWEDNIFLQSNYQFTISKKWRYKSLVKLNYAYLRYLDPLYFNLDGKLDNRYHQREYYWSNIVEYNPLVGLKFGIANDLMLQNMSANLDKFPFPSRYGILTNFAGSYRWKYLRITASVLHTCVFERPKNGKQSVVSRFTPAASIDFRLLKRDSLYLNLMYHNIFRLPSFNDLYYTLSGNRDLKPENVQQFAVGLSYQKRLARAKTQIFLLANGYYNHIWDKIVAVPTKNLFVWSMLNFGRVNVYGADVSMEVQVRIFRYLYIKLLTNYSWQNAFDMTDPKSKTYKHQLPYTPQHSVTASMGLEFTWFTVSYNLLAVGSRYKLGQNVEANRLQPYFDHSIGVVKMVKLKSLSLIFSVEALNLANKNYEIVANFPVQGIAWRAKMGILFKG